MSVCVNVYMNVVYEKQKIENNINDNNKEGKIQSVNEKRNKIMPIQQQINKQKTKIIVTKNDRE